MKFYIKETKENVELSVFDNKSGCEYTADFIGSWGGFETDKNGDKYFKTKDDYDWWCRSCEKEQRINDFMFEFDYDGKSEIHEKIADACYGELDLETHLDRIISIIEEVENEEI